MVTLATILAWAAPVVHAQAVYRVAGPESVTVGETGIFEIQGPGGTAVTVVDSCGDRHEGTLPFGFIVDYTAEQEWPAACLLTVYVAGDPVVTKRVTVVGAPRRVDPDRPGEAQTGNGETEAEQPGGLRRWTTIFDNLPPAMQWLGWQVAIWLFPIIVAALLLMNGVGGLWPGLGATATMAFCIWASDISPWMFLALIIPIASTAVIAHYARTS